ncbi:hypothetical protein CDD80_506 [Ophiocordyceps camponoti-rufipedis]|uniref:Lipocalin/cytosolic fatty-acid binding domain-containing protein n=1 Tax=Ophiocordyceps camponoti-rufipedis TaxID=2004952 RepID=A0A2C5XPA2_9HYPO|nr:hypothetical protein CDD80_506 [Ophiocordyceps camponoti-rufipedis]
MRPTYYSIHSTYGSLVQTYWDGDCFYPYGWDGFKVDAHLGRWFYVAGHEPKFKQRCSCVTVEYTRKKRNRIGVEEHCQLEEFQQGINVTGLFLSEDWRKGVMEPPPKRWGKNGVYRVEFQDAFHNDNYTQACMGPNYIVADQKPDHSIVIAANMSRLYILARSPYVNDKTIDPRRDF